MNYVIKLENLQSIIREIRRQKVILDSDVAELYKVETKRINEAVRNNPDKFPPGYVIELNQTEFDTLRSKISSTKFSRTRVLPKAFTEKGLYMLATILKSKRATRTTIAIIETFAKLRELGRNLNEMAETKEEIKNGLLKKSAELMSEILESDMHVSDTETFVEVNFALLKFRHTIKKKKS